MLDMALPSTLWTIMSFLGEMNISNEWDKNAKSIQCCFSNKIPVQIHFIYCSHPNDDFPVNRCVLVSSTTTSKTLIDGMMPDDSDAK